MISLSSLNSFAYKISKIIFISGFFLFAQGGIAQFELPELGFVFEDTSLPSVYITLSAVDLEFLYDEDNAFSNELKLAHFRFERDGTIEEIENIGFRLRGNTSRQSEKKSFKVDFNYFQSGRKWHGLQKLNLNGEHNDPSISRAKISWDILREAGLPGSRANHVKLFINDNYHGVYLNVEHIDDQFIDSYYSNEAGNLYKCIYPSDLNYKGNDPNLYKEEFWGRRAYQLKNNTYRDDYTHFANFIDILNNTPDEELYCELSKIFNLHSFIKYLAIDVLIGNWDGPHWNKNNFYLYHNPRDNRLEYLPYDLDNVMGIDWFDINWANRNIYQWSNIQDTERPLYDRIMENLQLKDLFSQYIIDIIQNIFNSDSFENKIFNIRDMISDAVVEDPFYSQDYGFSHQDFLNSFDQNINYNHVKNNIIDYINQRSESTLNQVQDYDIQALIRNYKSDIKPNQQHWNFYLYTQNVTNDAHQVQLYYKENNDTIQSQILKDNGEGFDQNANDGIFSFSLTTHSFNVINYHIEINHTNGQQLRFPICGTKTIWTSPHQTTMPNITINELMAKNNNAVTINNENYDWLELYNNTNQPINYSNYYLTDNLDQPFQYNLPSNSLASDDYLLFWASQETNFGNYHLPFKLSASGDNVALFHCENNELQLIDYTKYDSLQVDHSWARIPNGSGPWIETEYYTPDTRNDNQSGIYTANGTLELMIFPNPTSDLINIQWNKPTQIISKISLFDINGNQLSSTHLPSNTTSHQLSITKYNPGLYFLNISDRTERNNTYEIIKFNKE